MDAYEPLELTQAEIDLGMTAEDVMAVEEAIWNADPTVPEDEKFH